MVSLGGDQGGDGGVEKMLSWWNRSQWVACCHISQAVSKSRICLAIFQRKPMLVDLMFRARAGPKEIGAVALVGCDRSGDILLVSASV